MGGDLCARRTAVLALRSGAHEPESVVLATSFWLDPKEHLVAVLMTQKPSTPLNTRILYKNLVYGVLSR